MCEEDRCVAGKRVCVKEGGREGRKEKEWWQAWKQRKSGEGEGREGREGREWCVVVAGRKGGVLGKEGEGRGRGEAVRREKEMG